METTSQHSFISALFVPIAVKAHENLVKYDAEGPDMMVILFLSIQEAGVSPRVANF